MRACMRSARSPMSISPRTGTPRPCATRSNAQLRPDPISVLACERVREDFDARFSAKARHYLYRIVDRRGAPGARARSRLGRVPRPRCRRDARGGASLDRPSRLHHLPLHRVPGEIARQDARPPRRVAPRARSSVSSIRALLPAQSGALHGGLAQARGRREMGDGRAEAACCSATAAAAARWRPLKGSISSRSTIEGLRGAGRIDEMDTSPSLG